MYMFLIFKVSERNSYLVRFLLLNVNFYIIIIYFCYFCIFWKLIDMNIRNLGLGENK